MFDFLQICLRKAKPVCKIPHMFILADVWLLPNMFGKNQTRWYIYTWVLFSTHVWILTHRYGKRHTCVQKATQLYVCKCLAFSTHVWEKPLTCLFPPELWVSHCFTGLRTYFVFSVAQLLPMVIDFFGFNWNFNGKMTKINKMAKNHFSGVQNGSQSV